MLLLPIYSSTPSMKLPQCILSMGHHNLPDQHHQPKLGGGALRVAFELSPHTAHIFHKSGIMAGILVGIELDAI
jgi:hypothetical protein